MKKRMIAGLIFIASVIILGGIYLTTNTKATTIYVPAKTLVQEYMSNEKSADEQYLGKIVAVSGAVAQILSDSPYTILLEGGSGYVQCEFKDEPTTEIEEGSSITVQGLCTGYLLDVILTNSKIVTDETN
ncbi:MAG: hypothetical protein ABJG41_15885 [Cyclobacteriaceae bacterium]